MRELTPETITDAVLDQMATTPDPRLKTIMASAVKHLHAFARDVNLTPAEWIKGIEFMTAAAMIVLRRGSGVVAIWSSTASVIVSGVNSRMRHSLTGRLFVRAAGCYCSKPNRLLGINTRRSKAAPTPPHPN